MVSVFSFCLANREEDLEGKREGEGDRREGDRLDLDRQDAESKF